MLPALSHAALAVLAEVDAATGMPHPDALAAMERVGIGRTAAKHLAFGTSVELPHWMFVAALGEELAAKRAARAAARIIEDSEERMQLGLAPLRGIKAAREAASNVSAAASAAASEAHKAASFAVVAASGVSSVSTSYGQMKSAVSTRPTAAAAPATPADATNEAPADATTETPADATTEAPAAEAAETPSSAAAASVMDNVGGGAASAGSGAGAGAGAGAKRRRSAPVSAASRAPGARARRSLVGVKEENRVLEICGHRPFIPYLSDAVLNPAYDRSDLKDPYMRYRDMEFHCLYANGVRYWMRGNGKPAELGGVASQRIWYDYIDAALAAKTMRVYEHRTIMSPSQLKEATVDACAEELAEEPQHEQPPEPNAPRLRPRPPSQRLPQHL